MKTDRWFVEVRDVRNPDNPWRKIAECATRADARRMRDEMMTAGLMEARILQYELKGVVR